jgi:hypothetical protein
MGTWTDEDRERAADLLWEAVERTRDSQRWLIGDPDPSHEQFYRFGGALTALAHVTAELALSLAARVIVYPDRFVLRDDAGDDPVHRIYEAGVHLSCVDSYLQRATESAAAYHSAIGHIAIQEGDDGEPLRRR